MKSHVLHVILIQTQLPGICSDMANCVQVNKTEMGDWPFGSLACEPGMDPLTTTILVM